MQTRLTPWYAAAAATAFLAGCGGPTSTTSSNPKTAQVKTTALKVTAPQAHSIVHGRHVTVRGTATPGASVALQAPTDNAAATTVSADPQGRWHARILLDRGDNPLTVQASYSAGSTVYNPSRLIVIHVRYTITDAQPVADQQEPHRRPVLSRSTTTSTTTVASSTSSTITATARPMAAIQKAVNELLTVDTGAPPTAGDTQAVSADFVQLQGRCREAPDKLAAEIWASVQDLHKNGVQEDAVAVSGHLATIAAGLNARSTPTDCRGLLAAYLVLREQ